MSPRAMYVGKRPHRQGYCLIYGVLGLVLLILLAGAGVGLHALWESPLVVGPVRPAPTATPLPTPTATPVPIVSGLVVDAYTGRPLADVEIDLGQQALRTDGAGGFRLPLETGRATLHLTREDYAPTTHEVTSATSAPRIELRPTRLAGVVKDAAGQPVAGAKVSAGTVSTTTDASGLFDLRGVAAGASLTVEAPDYAPHSEPVGQRTSLAVRLRTATVTGRVMADGRPLAKASVALGTAVAQTDSDGRFRLSGVLAAGSLIAKASGHRAFKRPAQPGDTVEVTLTPFEAKAIYLTHLTAADEKRLTALLALVRRTELNAVVVDVKGEHGELYYASRVPLARSIGAVQPAYDLPKLITRLHAEGIYVIARQVIMEDGMLAKARPDLAVRNKKTGQAWKDYNDLLWLNAYKHDVWDYNAAIARELADLGVDEVQYDYVRFPSDGDLGVMDFGQPNTEMARRAAIAGLLGRARDALAPTTAYLAADVFGLTTVAEDDMGIGQYLEALTDVVDYLCPMVYPSHYAPGSFGHAVPAAEPYAIVNTSLARASRRLGNGRARLRPWLQDFDLNGVNYTPKMVRVQITASEENKTSGWMIWNSGNYYQEKALKPDGN